MGVNDGTPVNQEDKDREEYYQKYMEEHRPNNVSAASMFAAWWCDERCDSHCICDASQEYAREKAEEREKVGAKEDEPDD